MQQTSVATVVVETRNSKNLYLRRCGVSAAFGGTDSMNDRSLRIMKKLVAVAELRAPICGNWERTRKAAEIMSKFFVEIMILPFFF